MMTSQFTITLAKQHQQELIAEAAAHRLAKAVRRARRTRSTATTPVAVRRTGTQPACA